MKKSESIKYRSTPVWMILPPSPRLPSQDTSARSMASFDYDAATARSLGVLAQRASAEDTSLELPGVCWLAHVNIVIGARPVRAGSCGSPAAASPPAVVGYIRGVVVALRDVRRGDDQKW